MNAMEAIGPQTPITSTTPSSTSATAAVSATPVSSRKTTQAAADTSSDVEKKHKDKFVKEMSKVVVKILDPYRKKGVRGHIGNTTDFKHLAKKVCMILILVYITGVTLLISVDLHNHAQRTEALQVHRRA